VPAAPATPTTTPSPAPLAQNPKTPAAFAAAKADAASALPAMPPPAVATEPEAGAAPAAVAAGKDATPPEPKTAVAEDDEPNEEELLKKAVPNAEQAVIGANGAEPAPAPSKSEPEEREPVKRPPVKIAAGKPVRPPPPPKPKPPVHETAILHLKTTPVGAIVRTKGQVLGRTPINLHFRTGNTYELTFVKSGYQPASRLVAVVNAKDKTLALALKKRPAPKKAASHAFFHPHR
jgi:hypothetical protein